MFPLILGRNFMSLRNYGMIRPNDAGGPMRRRMLALAVLLLMCTLVAGAVGATDVIRISDENGGGDLGQYLSEGKSVILDVNVTYSDSISINGGNSSILDLNGHTLTLSKNNGNNGIIGLGDESYDKRGTLKVTDTSSQKNGQINATESSLFWVGNSSNLTLEDGTFKAKIFVIAGNAARFTTGDKGPKYGNPVFDIKDVTITSTTDMAVFIPADGSTATFTDTKINGVLGGLSLASGKITVTNAKIHVTGNSEKPARYYPDEDGSIDDGSAIGVHKKSDAYTGDLTLKILGTTELISDDKFALNNYIRTTDPGTTKVIIADSVTTGDGKIASAFYRTKGNPDTIKVATISGSFEDLSGNKLLYPGLNQSGVTWDGNSDGYTLSITEAGNYKLMDSVNLKSMTVSAADVTIDGNKDAVTITTVSGNSPVIKSTGTGVTLQNLNMIGTGDFTQGTFIQLAGANTNLANSIIDFSKAKTTGSSSFHTVYLSGAASKISG
ncbi:MAG: hypothetical protein LBL85_06585, partial [Methanocalculaceae archaeon]|nr:hypothetical protein [Methanocalculaceae archaeon]